MLDLPFCEHRLVSVMLYFMFILFGLHKLLDYFWLSVHTMVMMVGPRLDGWTR